MPCWLSISVAHFKIKDEPFDDTQVALIGLEIHKGNFEDAPSCKHEREFCNKLEILVKEFYSSQFPKGKEVKLEELANGDFKPITQH